MKLEKAIEILGDSCWDFIPETEQDTRDAIKLGIEALKRERDGRDSRIPGWNTPLPGETA